MKYCSLQPKIKYFKCNKCLLLIFSHINFLKQNLVLESNQHETWFKLQKKIEERV